jgi:hypothetical protein
MRLRHVPTGVGLRVEELDTPVENVRLEEQDFHLVEAGLLEPDLHCAEAREGEGMDTVVCDDLSSLNDQFGPVVGSEA